MRRVRVADAQPGMLLAREIFDWSGQLVMDTSKSLDEPRIMLLKQSDTTHVLIQDRITADIVIQPLVPEDTEADTAVLLKRLLEKNRGRTLSDMALETATVDRLIRAIIHNMNDACHGALSNHNSITPENYEYIHGVRSTMLSIYIGRVAGYGQEELVNLGKAALLKDIGYACLPTALTAKTDRLLSTAEAEEKNRHPALGYQILAAREDIPPEVKRAVAEHHERWDGRGYSRNLAAEAISEPARIISIAEAYHRLIVTADGKQTLTPPQAAAEIKRGSGTRFDPRLVDIFLRKFSFCNPGDQVRLSNGEYGVIISDNLPLINRPAVRICQNSNGTKIKAIKNVNLAESANREISLDGMNVSFPAPPQEPQYYVYEKNEPAVQEGPRTMKFTPLFKPRPGSIPVSETGGRRSADDNSRIDIKPESSPAADERQAITKVRIGASNGIKVRQVERRPEAAACENEPDITAIPATPDTPIPPETDMPPVFDSGDSIETDNEPPGPISGPPNIRRRPRRRVVHVIRRRR